jgi:prevent-host-death family protein
MKTVRRRISSREFRAELSDVVGRVAYGGERVALTRNGKVAAVLISKEDLETLERLEMAADVADYRVARASDDGVRVSLEELEAELG